jgi:O-antigen/teichoic acid export membrane protein
MMALYVIVNSWNNIYSHFLNGVGIIKMQLIFGAIGAIINVPLAIFLGKHFGISGVILSTIILGLSGFILLPMQYNKIISGTATGIWGK